MRFSVAARLGRGSAVRTRELRGHLRAGREDRDPVHSCRSDHRRRRHRGGRQRVRRGGTFRSLRLRSTNQFGSPGDRTAMRALNVNTIDEVPDSSWFVNRIGMRSMSIAEIVRGANTFDPAEARRVGPVDDCERQGSRRVPTRVPRASAPGIRGRCINSKSIPTDHPRLATGAEFIGTLIYHALGYHVQDFYLIKVDPRNITISEKATIRDASGKRKVHLARSAEHPASGRQGRGRPGLHVRAAVRGRGRRTLRISRNSEATTRTTSSRTSIVGSCGQTASSPPGSRMMIHGRSIRATCGSKLTDGATSVTTCTTSAPSWEARRDHQSLRPATTSTT